MITRLIVFTFLELVLSAPGCEKAEPHPNTAELPVDFEWEGMKPCGWGNPEIHVGIGRKQRLFPENE